MDDFRAWQVTARDGIMLTDRVARPGAAVSTIDPLEGLNPFPAPIHRRDALLDALRLVAVGWLLLVGLWSGPSWGATLAYPNGFVGVEIGLVAILLLAALRRRVASPRAYPFLWPCLTVLALEAVVTGVRIAVGSTPGDALRLWQAGEPMARGLLLYLAITGHPRAVRVAWVCLLSGMAVLAGAAIVQHLTGVTRWYADLDGGWRSGLAAVRVRPALLRSQGLTSYINLTAAMLASALPYWWIPPILRSPSGPWARRLLLLGGVIVTLGLWYGNSRGPMLAVALVAVLFIGSQSPRWGWSLLAGGLVAMLAFWSAPWWALALVGAVCLAGMRLRRWPLRYALTLVLGLAFAVGVRSLDASVPRNSPAWRLSETGLSHDAGIRFIIYRDAVRAVAASPWLGIGDTAAAWRMVHLPFPRESTLPRTQQNYHNQYLQWAVAEGLPVAVAYTLLVLWAVVWCWRQAPSRRTPFTRAVGWATAAGLSIFLLTNLVDAHFWRLEGSGFFWSLLAVSAAIGDTATRVDNADGAPCGAP